MNIKSYLMFVLLGACTPSATVDVIEAPPPVVWRDPRLQTVENCPFACVRLRANNCPSGFQPDGGDSCEEICTEAIQSGYLYWPSTCIVHAQSLEEIRLCGVACP